MLTHSGCACPADLEHGYNDRMHKAWFDFFLLLLPVSFPCILLAFGNTCRFICAAHCRICASLVWGSRQSQAGQEIWGEVFLESSGYSGLDSWDMNRNQFTELCHPKNSQPLPTYSA